MVAHPTAIDPHACARPLRVRIARAAVPAHASFVKKAEERIIPKIPREPLETSRLVALGVKDPTRYGSTKQAFRNNVFDVGPVMDMRHHEVVAISL